MIMDLDFGQPTNTEVAFLAQHSSAATDAVISHELGSDQVAGLSVTSNQEVETFRISKAEALPYLYRAQERYSAVVRDRSATAADKIRAENILFQAKQDLKNAYDSELPQPSPGDRPQEVASRGKSLFRRLIDRFQD